MNHLHKTSLRLAFASGLLALLVASPQKARAQVVQNNIGAPFVQPVGEPFEIGPVLDVIPYVLSDGYTINLTLIPTFNEFVQYDNPNEVLTSGLTLPAGAVVVPTVLPRFRVRQVHTTVNVWDGQTVVLGGLVSDNVTSIKDKVPILGDLPLVGRLFRSESKNTAKKNLVIFVTPTIIDPAGNRLHSDDEMPFAQTTFPSQAIKAAMPPVIAPPAGPPGASVTIEAAPPVVTTPVVPVPAAPPVTAPPVVVTPQAEVPAPAPAPAPQP